VRSEDQAGRDDVHPALDSDAEPLAPTGGVTRRRFLTRGSMTVVAAGLVTALPGLPLLATEASSDAPEVDGAATADGAALAEPLVVQVRNLQTGEMSLYQGEREIAFRDTELASRLARAAR
jgi:hypothetical protein